MMEDYEVFFYLSFRRDSRFSEKVATAVGTLFFGWIAVHFANNFGKDFVHVHLIPSRRLNERAIPGLS